MEKKNNPTQVLDIELALEQRNKNKTKKTLKIVGIVLASLLLLFGAVACGINKFLDDKLGLVSIDNGEGATFDETAGDEDLDQIPELSEAPEPDTLPDYEIIDGWFDGSYIAEEYEDEVLNILLIGADTVDGNHARSDTMILMSINPIKKRIVFTSFMRDSYIELPGRGYNRLNAAHAKGGPQYLIETLEANFGINIDNYAKVDFTSFQQAVNAIGGVTLTVNDINYNYFYDWDGIYGLSQEEATNGYHTVHLDGDEALMYARTRKGHRVDNSDFGRTLHQRDLLSQFVTNCKDASFSQLNDVLNCVLPYVVTDMPREEIKDEILNVLSYVSYDVVMDSRVPCAGSYEDVVLESGAMVLNINVPANAKFVKAKIYG